MKITVIVPTYRRPQDLERCLEALKKQNRQADEVLIVIRDTDTETWEFFATFDAQPLNLQTLAVTEPGVIAAMNLGLDTAQGEIIAFTDDDSAPHADWLSRIESYYVSDDKIGGVGGRDFLYNNNQLQQGSRKVVGRVQWFGRVIGNHHLGVGEAREVDVLKGVNMSFRRQAIGNKRFDRRLLGSGAQVHFEIEFCLALKKAGWKLIYDPLIQVDHYSGQRFDNDKRDQFDSVALSNLVHNETLILLENLPGIRRFIFLIWAFWVGTRRGRGLVQGLRFLPSEGILSIKKLIASLKGRLKALKTWRKTKEPNSVVVTFTNQNS